MDKLSTGETHYYFRPLFVIKLHRKINSVSSIYYLAETPCQKCGELTFLLPQGDTEIPNECIFLHEMRHKNVSMNIKIMSNFDPPLNNPVFASSPNQQTHNHGDPSKGSDCFIKLL